MHRFVSDPIDVLQLRPLGSHRSNVRRPLVRIPADGLHTYRWFPRFDANVRQINVSQLTLCARNSSGRVSRSPREPSLPSCSSSANETGRLPTVPRKNMEGPLRGCSLVSANREILSKKPICICEFNLSALRVQNFGILSLSGWSYIWVLKNCHLHS